MGIVLDRWDRGIPIPFPQILLTSQFHGLRMCQCVVDGEGETHSYL